MITKKKIKKANKQTTAYCKQQPKYLKLVPARKSKLEASGRQSPPTSVGILKEHLGGGIYLFVHWCSFYRINFLLAAFTNSDVTDLNKWRDSLEESFRDMRHLLLTSKLWNIRQTSVSWYLYRVELHGFRKVPFLVLKQSVKDRLWILKWIYTLESRLAWFIQKVYWCHK